MDNLGTSIFFLNYKAIVIAIYLCYLVSVNQEFLTFTLNPAILHQNLETNLNGSHRKCLLLMHFKKQFKEINYKE